MKMQGEPVTLSNIETNIKKNLNLTDDKGENVFAKILLFPFRLIAIVFEALGKTIGPLLYAIGNIVRGVVGLTFILVPVALFVCLTFILFIIIGVAEVPYIVSSTELPLEMIVSGIPRIAAIAIFATFAIPLIFIGILGSSLLTKRKVGHPAFNLALLGLFVVSIIFAATTLPGFIKDYRREAKVEEEQSFPINAKVVMLKANPNEDMEYSQVNLYLRGYSGKDLKLVKDILPEGFLKEKQWRIQG